MKYTYNKFIIINSLTTVIRDMRTYILTGVPYEDSNKPADAYILASLGTKVQTNAHEVETASALSRRCVEVDTMVFQNCALVGRKSGDFHMRPMLTVNCPKNAFLRSKAQVYIYIYIYNI